MKNEIIKALFSLISDIEEASPNTKSKLQEIYPISFSINLKGHKTIYISLDKNGKDISFTEKASIDFEIRSSVSEILQLLITRKIKKDILFGDIEIAVVIMNTFKQLKTGYSCGQPEQSNCIISDIKWIRIPDYQQHITNFNMNI